MKKITFILCFVFSISSSQTWKTITPFNSANIIRDMETTPNGVTYVVTESPIRMYKTSDGVIWSQFHTSLQVPSDLLMLDNNNGFLISNSGILEKTTDAWQTSSEINYGTQLSYNKLFFVNHNVGFIAGYRRFIQKTLDGGQTWSLISIPSTLIPTGIDITDIHFVNEQIGFVITSNGRVLKTTDQGINWTSTQLQATGYLLNSLLFVNENTGMAVGPLGEIYRTTNQGETWALTDTDVGIAYDIRMRNGVLYIVGSNRAFIRSTDMGASWSSVQTVTAPGEGIGISRLYAVTFRGNDIIVAGEKGTIFKANNPSGTQWSLFYNPILGDIPTTDLQFMNINQGVMVGSGNIASAVYYTADGGNTWQRKAIGATGLYKSVNMKPNGQGLMVGKTSFAKTTDFGQTWSSFTPMQPESLANTKCWLKDNGDFFVGKNPGAPIDDGLVKRSGTTWTQFTDVNQVGEIQFANEQIGYAAVGPSSYPGKMWKTVDGGTSWSTLNSFTPRNLAEMQIVTPDKVYVRDDTYTNTNWQYSEDGGQTWNFVSNFPKRFHFFDELNAYGINNETKDVYKTVDGGQTWQIIIHSDNTLCGYDKFVWFPDKIIQANDQFLVCILNIDQSLQVHPIKNTADKKVVVYPNPTNGILNISEPAYEITIADITGKKLGSYQNTNQINIGSLKKGIYFLSVITEDGTKHVQKIIKD